MNNSQIEDFRIEFNDENNSQSNLKEHEIEAKILAHSLIGVSNVLEESNLKINGSSTEIFVKVKGTFEPGSFIVQLALFLSSGGLQEVADIAEILGFCGLNPKSLIQFFKKTQGKKIVHQKKIGGDNYEVTIEGSGDPIVVNGNVLLLYEAGKVRKEFDSITSVLEGGDISQIKLYSKGTAPETISKEEREYFKFYESDQFDEIEGIDYFLITRPDFEGRSTGWRVAYLRGDNLDSQKQPDDFFITISDKGFLSDVKLRRTVITQGTRIKARFKKIIDKMENYRPKTEITEVIEVIGVKILRPRDRTLDEF